MIKGAGQPGYRVRYRPGEVRSPRRGRRLRGFQEFFVGITRAAYWLGLGVLVIYAAYQSWWLFWYTKWFLIDEVVVSGNQTLQKQEILSLTKIELGTHFYRYDPQSIRSALLAHPRVRDVQVAQVSPKKIEIQLVENRPVVRTVLDGEPQEIGEDGRILGRAQTQTTTLPLLVGLPRARAKQGQPPRIAADVFSQIPAWLAALQDSFLATFETVDFSNPYRVEVHRKNTRFFLAEPADLKEMAPAALRTLADAQQRHSGIQTMDMRFRTIVVRYGTVPDGQLSEPQTRATTWAASAAAALHGPAAGPAATTTGLIALTDHPAVRAAASRTSTGPEMVTSESAMFTPDELAALGEPQDTTPQTDQAAKPAFTDEDSEPDEVPDPAYIYSPPSVPRDEEEAADGN